MRFCASRFVLNLATPILLIGLFVALSTPARGEIGGGDIAAGETKSAACVACHGAQGNSTNPEWPKLAGQGAKYIVKQLQLFKSHQRVNPLMNSQVATLSDQDMLDIAAYFAAQEPAPGAADESLLALGESIYRGGIADKKVPACLSCHGPDGMGNPAAKFPRLSFQHAQYLATRLKAYRAEEDYAGAEIMNGVAQSLSDEEIKAVASYMQGLH